MTRVMKSTSMNGLKRWLIDYIRSVIEKDQTIRFQLLMKQAHTMRVYKNMRRIGSDLGFGGRELWLAELIGLFHDLGRFEQFLTYGTYKDSESINHAAHSIFLLKQHAILDFVEKRDLDLIFTAIAHHNQRSIPPDLSPEKTVFSQLIRDADKLDIFRLIAHQQLEGKKNIEVSDLLSPILISPEVMAAAEENVLVDLRFARNSIDLHLLHMCWVFDINFTPTFERIQEKRYLEKMRSELPDTKEIDSIYHLIQSHVKTRLELAN